MGEVYWDTMWSLTTGCTKISAGCANCWAVIMANRQQANPAVRGVYQSGVVASYETDIGKYQEKLVRVLDWTGKIQLLPHALEKPFGWRKPRIIFVNGMSDLFHEDVPMEYIARAWATMALCPQHIFLILTKRTERMQLILNDELRDMFGTFSDYVDRELTTTTFVHPLANVWIGATVENNEQALIRSGQLLRTRAAHHWLSVEPMLSGIDLVRWLDITYSGERGYSAVKGTAAYEDSRPSIDFVACGPENGHGKRPFHEHWATDLLHQCQNAGVPFFYKGGRLNGELYLREPDEFKNLRLGIKE